MADILVPKFVRVAVQREYEIRFLNHGEQQAFGEGVHAGVVYTDGIRSGGECKRLEFDPRQDIPRDDPLSQGCTVSRQVISIRLTRLTSR